VKKKDLFILFILSFLIILFVQYAFWKTVYITGFGAIKVPRAWIVTENDNIIFFTDKLIDEEGYKIYLISDKQGNNGENISHYKYFENVEYLELIRGAIFSIGSHYNLKTFNINGKIEEKFDICLKASGYRSIYFLAWDNSIDERLIRKITKSYWPD